MRLQPPNKYNLNKSDIFVVIFFKLLLCPWRKHLSKEDYLNSTSFHLKVNIIYQPQRDIPKSSCFFCFQNFSRTFHIHTFPFAPTITALKLKLLYLALGFLPDLLCPGHWTIPLEESAGTRIYEMWRSVPAPRKRCPSLLFPWRVTAASLCTNSTEATVGIPQLPLQQPGTGQC